MLRLLIVGLVTAEALVRSEASPYEICGEQSGSGTGLSPSAVVFSRITPHTLYTHLWLHVALTRGTEVLVLRSGSTG